VNAEEFYQEHLGVGPQTASRIGWFMRFAVPDPAIEHVNPWTKNGLARVYFTLWSQNRLPAIHGLRAAFYDPDQDEIMVDIRVASAREVVTLRALVVASRARKSLLAGAKTRNSLTTMMERFDAEKAVRD